MAIYGVGAFYHHDVSGDFVSKGLACVGWDEKDAPSLYKLLKHVKMGDIVYIKSHPPNIGLIIKAVGIVTGDTPLSDKHLGECLPIEWIWQGHEVIGRVDDQYNVRNITLYEEFNPEVQKRTIELLVGRLRRRRARK